MTINLTNYERTLSLNILKRCNCTVTKDREKFIEFKYKSDQIYAICNSSGFQYHIIVRGKGDTYGCWNHIEELLLWITKNLNTSFK